MSHPQIQTPLSSNPKPGVHLEAPLLSLMSTQHSFVYLFLDIPRQPPMTRLRAIIQGRSVLPPECAPFHFQPTGLEQAHPSHPDTGSHLLPVSWLLLEPPE